MTLLEKIITEQDLDNALKILCKQLKNFWALG
jgi:hypothetical protein